MRHCRLVVWFVFTVSVAGQAALGGAGKGKTPDTLQEESKTPHASKTRGALQVKAVSAKPADWFMVFQNGKQLVPPGKPLLNSTVELAPGTYVVRVNKTERKVTIGVGEATVLLAGELVVEAKEGTPGWFTPYQGKDAKLASNPPVLNRPLALFAGKYTVFYRESGIAKPENLGEVEVKPGRRTVLKR